MAKTRPKFNRGTYVLHKTEKWLARVLQNRWLEQKYLLEPLNFCAKDTFSTSGMYQGLEKPTGTYQLHGPAIARDDFMFRATIQLTNDDWIKVDRRTAMVLYAKKG